MHARAHTPIYIRIYTFINNEVSGGCKCLHPRGREKSKLVPAACHIGQQHLSLLLTFAPLLGYHPPPIMSDKQRTLCMVHYCPPHPPGRAESIPDPVSRVTTMLQHFDVTSRWRNWLSPPPQTKAGSSSSAALENACEIRLSSSPLLSPRQPHPFCHKKHKSIKAAFTCIVWN